MLSTATLRDIFIDRAFDELYDLHTYLKDRYSWCGIMDFSSPSKLMSFILDHIVNAECHAESSDDDEKQVPMFFEEGDTQVGLLDDNASVEQEPDLDVRDEVNVNESVPSTVCKKDKELNGMDPLTLRRSSLGASQENL